MNKPPPDNPNEPRTAEALPTVESLIAENESARRFTGADMAISINAPDDVVIPEGPDPTNKSKQFVFNNVRYYTETPKEGEPLFLFDAGYENNIATAFNGMFSGAGFWSESRRLVDGFDFTHWCYVSDAVQVSRPEPASQPDADRCPCESAGADLIPSCGLPCPYCGHPVLQHDGNGCQFRAPADEGLEARAEVLRLALVDLELEKSRRLDDVFTGGFGATETETDVLYDITTRTTVLIREAFAAKGAELVEARKILEHYADEGNWRFLSAHSEWKTIYIPWHNDGTRDKNGYMKARNFLAKYPDAPEGGER